jgi:hypothetical protein
MRLRVVGLVALSLALMLSWNGAAHAQNNAANQAFTLAPGGKATINFESFCIDYGKKFPDQVGLPPTNVADPAVVGVLNNAVGQNATGNNAKEVQFAIWKARGAQGAPAPGALGAQLAQNPPQPAAPQGATSVIDALKNNQIKATAGSWQGVGDKLTINNFDDFYKGTGQLQVENTSGQELTLYMPIGTVFPAPSAEFQSMAGYATNVAVNNPAPQTQSLPDTGLADGLSAIQLLLLALIGLDFAAIGVLLKRRASA